jgi:mono/diheme cytochrome c family protein
LGTNRRAGNKQKSENELAISYEIFSTNKGLFPTVISDTSRSSAAARGKSYFLINCQSCHDADGRALANIDFIAADLTAPDTWFYGDSPLHIFRSIKFGAGLEMPPFEGTIDNQTIWQIVAHILNIGPKATRPTEE